MVFTERQKTELIRLIQESSEKMLSDIVGNKTFMETLAKTVADIVSHKIDECINKYDSRISDLEKKIKGVQDDNEELQIKIDHLEQKSRLHKLRVYGLPEKSERGRDLKSEVLKMFQTRLGIDNAAVNNCYRIEAKRSSLQKKGRAVIVEFGNMQDRNAVYFSKKKLKNSGLIVAEELTARRFGLLNLAKEKFGRRNVWTIEGKLFAKINGSKKRLNTEEDIVQ